MRAWWQPEQASGAVCMSTCWRVVCAAISAGSCGTLGGGSGIGVHSTLRWMKAPRWMGELWLL